MKRRILALTLLLVLIFSTIGCASTPAQAPPPDLPRYTADQVITIAKAYAGDETYTTTHTSKPIEWSNNRIPERLRPKPQPPRTVTRTSKPLWKVLYLGKGIWWVEKEGRLGHECWYFHEDTSAFEKTVCKKKVG